MNRQEFIETLGARLSEELSVAEVLSQTQYYQGYIDGELKKGKTEEEILAELGDPLLIAKTILESPHEESPFGRAVPDEQEAYYEGAYAGENQKSPEDVKEQIRASREATQQKYREAEERAFMHEAEKEQGFRAGHHEEPHEAEKVKGDVVGKGGIFRDANGDFNWGLFALLLAGVMILVAVGWIIGKVFSIFGPVILVIIAVVLIVRTLSGKHQ